MPILNAPERIGTLIGNRYELRDAVGEGASAVLYAAMDRTLEREVGVKVMRRTGALSTGQERKRFRREAQTLARLRHPHLVEVYDVGETADGVPYVVMELLRGETLAARLERSPRLSASEALAITLPLMGALACAHDLGIIHRDVKPENIFLARHAAGATIPKLLDFGIAKLADEPALTSDGMILGTAAFMAPEQARGEPLHPSADVWAMGVTLFACLAGRLPFVAPTAAGVIMQATKHGTPRLEAPGLDRAIALVVERALALDVQQRMPNMRVLARALVQTARRASVTLPVDPDPVGLPEFAAWCGATANESATDELVVSATECLALVRKPATSQAADSSSALAVQEQRGRRLRRIAAPVAALTALAAMALWFGRAEELRSAPAPVIAAIGTPGSVVTPVLVEPAVPAEATPMQPASDAPLAQEPRDAGPGESATPARKTLARAKPGPVAAPVPDPLRACQAAARASPPERSARHGGDAMRWRAAALAWAFAGCATQSGVTPAASTLADIAPAAPLTNVSEPCAQGSAAAALPGLTQESSQALVARLGTGADPYWLQDGEWLPHGALLINEDFDFGTAMGLGAVGAGLAAKQRKDHNLARASELASSELSPEARTALDALRACGIHRYAIDWAGGKPGLRVVTDTFDASGKRTGSDARELAPGSTWWSGPLLAGQPPQP